MGVETVTDTEGTKSMEGLEGILTTASDTKKLTEELNKNIPKFLDNNNIKLPSDLGGTDDKEKTANSIDMKKLREEVIKLINEKCESIKKELDFIQKSKWVSDKPKDKFITNVNARIEEIKKAKDSKEIISAIDKLFQQPGEEGFQEKINTAKTKAKAIFNSYLVEHLNNVNGLIVNAKTEFEKFKKEKKLA